MKLQTLFVPEHRVLVVAPGDEPFDDAQRATVIEAIQSVIAGSSPVLLPRGQGDQLLVLELPTNFSGLHSFHRDLGAELTARLGAPPEIQRISVPLKGRVFGLIVTTEHRSALCVHHVRFARDDGPSGLELRASSAFERLPLVGYEVVAVPTGLIFWQSDGNLPAAAMVGPERVVRAITCLYQAFLDADVPGLQPLAVPVFRD